MPPQHSLLHPQRLDCDQKRHEENQIFAATAHVVDAATATTVINAAAVINVIQSGKVTAHLAGSLSAAVFENSIAGIRSDAPFASS